MKLIPKVLQSEIPDAGGKSRATDAKDGKENLEEKVREICFRGNDIRMGRIPRCIAGSSVETEVRSAIVAARAHQDL